MRKLMTIVALLCGAVGANAADPSWCVKWGNRSVSLIKAAGIVYNLKLISRHTATEAADDSEDSEIWATDDHRFSIGLAEGDKYWITQRGLPVTGEKAMEPIPDCP